MSSDGNKRILGRKERWRKVDLYLGRQKVVLGDLTVGGAGGLGRRRGRRDHPPVDDGGSRRGGRRRMAPRTEGGTMLLWSWVLLESREKRRDSLQHQALSRLPHVFLLDWRREGG